MPDKNKEPSAVVDVMKDAHETISLLYKKCGLAIGLSATESEERRLIREQVHRKTYER